MSQKFRRKIVGVLICAGICITILNFAPNLYAPVLWGTEELLSPTEFLEWVAEKGEEWMEDRYIEDWVWCLGEASNCCVVF